jgi:hypothetical protein
VIGADGVFIGCYHFVMMSYGYDLVLWSGLLWYFHFHSLVGWTGNWLELCPNEVYESCCLRLLVCQRLLSGIYKFIVLFYDLGIEQRGL